MIDLFFFVGVIIIGVLLSNYIVLSQKTLWYMFGILFIINIVCFFTMNIILISTTQLLLIWGALAIAIISVSEIEDNLPIYVFTSSFAIAESDKSKDISDTEELVTKLSDVLVELNISHVFSGNPTDGFSLNIYTKNKDSVEEIQTIVSVLPFKFDCIKLSV